MEHEFKVGQRVKVRESYGTEGYLRGGMAGVVARALTFNGMPEYSVVMDDKYSNIVAWIIREETLEAEDES